MNLLLDTHAILWYVLDAPQLSTTAAVLIEDADNVVMISPASLWEIAIKVSIGKLKLDAPFEDFIDLCLHRYAFRVLPVEPVHAARLASMPFPASHKDPFDRLLVAQAMVEGIPIVSNDAALDSYPVQRLW